MAIKLGFWARYLVMRSPVSSRTSSRARCMRLNDEGLCEGGSDPFDESL